MRSWIVSIVPLVVVLSLSTSVAHAQTKQTPHTLKLEAGAKSPKAKIADLAWLEGHWVGKGLDGITEEVWAPPLGNSMMGMFRVVKDGKIMFSELLFIVEEEGSLVLKIKHFDGDFKGWEEKDISQKFALVKTGPNEVYFEGLTYQKTDDHSLAAFVAMHNSKKEVKELEFRFSEAKKK